MRTLLILPLFPKMGGLREEGLSVICLPARRGSQGQARQGLVGGRAGEPSEGQAVGTATVPHVSLAHSPHLSFWTLGTSKRKQEAHFCLVWKLKVGASP